MNTKLLFTLFVISNGVALSSEKIPLLPIYEETESCSTGSISNEFKKILQHNIKTVKEFEKTINSNLSYTFQDSDEDKNKTLEELMQEWDEKKKLLQQYENENLEINTNWKKKVGGGCFGSWFFLSVHKKISTSKIIQGASFYSLEIGGICSLTGWLIGIVKNQFDHPECNDYSYHDTNNNCGLFSGSIPYIITGAASGLIIANVLVARATCLSREFEQKYPRYHATKEAIINTKAKIKDMAFNW